MKSIKYILILFLSLVGGEISAQNRALPLLELTPDARMAGMGGNQYGEAHSMLVYSNPTSLLYGEEKWNVSASTLLMPKLDDLNDRQVFYSASLSRRLGNHGLHVGFRYLGGLSVPTDDGKNLEPQDWTIDLGYSLRLWDHLSLTAGVSMIHSKVMESASTVAFNVGAYYRNTFDKGIKGDYVVGVSGYNMGPNLEYGDRLKETKLPAGFGGGGEVGMDIDRKNRVSLSMALQYCCMPEEAKLFSGNVGVEYGFNRLFYVRGGYKYAEHDYSHYALGAGIAYAGCKLDVCHQRGTGGNEVNQTWISLGVGF